MPFTKPSQHARFSRKTLNIIIVMTSIMILLFLNLPGNKTEEPTPPKTASKALTAAEKQALFATEEEANKLQAPTLIAKLPSKNHRINIQSWHTGKGAKVLFVASHEVPIMDLRLIFNAGSARDAEQPGLATFVNAMLNEGSKNYSVDSIAAGFEEVGAQFSNGSYRDMALVSLRTLAKPEYRQQALQIFYDLVAEPSFPSENLQRIRKQMLINLQREQQQPGTWIQRNFFQQLYGSHPYGSPSSGTEQSLGKISETDLRRFHQQYYVAANLVIAIVGDLDRQTAEQIANQIEQRLPQGQAAPNLPITTPLAASEEQLVEFPSTQSHILMGSLSIKRDSPLRYALHLGNEILGGGGFSSRLNKIIRQDNGLAYSVYSYFSPMAVKGPFIMGLQTRNDQRQQALELMRQTLQKFINQGPTETELNNAKEHIINSFPLSLASNSSIVGNLGAIGFYDLPLDYLDEYLKQIEKVTADEIRQAFAKTLHSDKMLTLILGPPERAPTDKQKNPSP